MIAFHFYDLFFLFAGIASCGFVYLDYVEGSFLRGLANVGMASFCAFVLFVRLGG